jgi:hypothetical protein
MRHWLGHAVAVIIIGVLAYLLKASNDKYTAATVEQQRTTQVSTDKQQVITKTSRVVTTKKDGTQIVREEKVDSHVKVSSEMTDKEIKVIEAALSRYALGIQYPVKAELPNLKEPILTGGVRLGNWPVWLEGQYNFGLKLATVGVSIEF